MGATHAIDVAAVVDGVDRALADQGDPGRAAQEKRYLKSDLAFHGVRVPAVRAVARGVRRAHPGLTHDDLVAVVTGLWDRPVHECRSAGVELLRAAVDLLGPDDAGLLEALLRRARTWALVDALAADVVGALAEAHPAALGPVLDRWASDEDLWLRRSALLTLLVPLRRGGGDWDRFARYADAMLDEREFFVRKAIGWVLRDTGRRRPDLVHGWLLPRASRASGVTWREALKPLDGAQRASLLDARAGGGTPRG